MTYSCHVIELVGYKILGLVNIGFKNFWVNKYNEKFLW
jgi:hypothetical protein